MDKTQVIDMVGVGEPWLKLMLRFANSTDTVHVIECQDKKEAARVRAAVNCIVVCRRTWCNMLVALRGTDVYVVKLAGAKKVRLIDGK